VQLMVLCDAVPNSDRLRIAPQAFSCTLGLAECVAMALRMGLMPSSEIFIAHLPVERRR
jgi:hypothetical protein